MDPEWRCISDKNASYSSLPEGNPQKYSPNGGETWGLAMIESKKSPGKRIQFFPTKYLGKT